MPWACIIANPSTFSDLHNEPWLYNFGLTHMFPNLSLSCLPGNTWLGFPEVRQTFIGTRAMSKSHSPKDDCWRNNSLLKQGPENAKGLRQFEFGERHRKKKESSTYLQGLQLHTRLHTHVRKLPETQKKVT